MYLRDIIRLKTFGHVQSLNRLYFVEVVKRGMVVLVIFFRFFKLFFLCSVVAIFDLVHGVEANFTFLYC